MRSYTARRQQKKLGQFCDRVRALNNPDNLNVVCGSILKSFGGPAGLMGSWRRLLDEAAAKRPGAPFVTRSYLAFMKLITSASAPAHRPVEADDDFDSKLADDLCSDEDLAALLQHHIRLAQQTAPQ